MKIEDFRKRGDKALSGWEIDASTLRTFGAGAVVLVARGTEHRLAWQVPNKRSFPEELTGEWTETPFCYCVLTRAGEDVVPTLRRLIGGLAPKAFPRDVPLVELCAEAASAREAFLRASEGFRLFPVLRGDVNTAVWAAFVAGMRHPYGVMAEAKTSHEALNALKAGAGGVVPDIAASAARKPESPLESEYAGKTFILGASVLRVASGTWAPWTEEWIERLSSMGLALKRKGEDAVLFPVSSLGVDEVTHLVLARELLRRGVLLGGLAVDSGALHRVIAECCGGHRLDTLVLSDALSAEEYEQIFASRGIPRRTAEE